MEQLHSLWIKKRAKGPMSLNWNNWLKKKHIATSDRDVRKKEKFQEYLNPFYVFDMFVSLSMNFEDEKMKYWQSSMHIQKLKNTGRKKNSLKMNLWIQPEELRFDDVIHTFFCKRGPSGPPIRFEICVFI